MEGKGNIKESNLTNVELIIPDIKPPLPLEPRELYKPIRPADAAAEVREGLRRSPELKEFFKPFNGQIVIEIGPGELLTGYEIALFSGARAYVGVEPYGFVDNLGRFLEEAERFVPKMPKGFNQIPRTAVKADALSFLRRLPDKSVSVFASQLVSVMVKEYQDNVVREIERVLHPQGAFIQYDSSFDLNTNLFRKDLVDPKLAKEFYFIGPLEKYQIKT